MIKDKSSLSKNDLTVLNQAYRENREKEKAEIAEFNANVREPDLTYVEPESGLEFGYWRVPGGLIVLCKNSKGQWLPRAGRRDIVNNELQRLASLYFTVPTPMKKDETP